jgi:membrane-anchored protein YejM (alkaline phosphatase superfamily)
VIPPTIFKALKTLEPQSNSAAYYKWSGIGQILYTSPLSRSIYTNNDQEALEEGINYLKQTKPRLIFFYFDDVDGWGHASGFGKDYFNAIRVTDNRVGKIMSTIRELGILDKTAVLVVSDHGRQINGTFFFGIHSKH